jgi:hypothetical protein
MVMAEGRNNWMGITRGTAPGIIVAVALLLAMALPAYGANEWQTSLEDDFSNPETMFYTGQAGEAFYAIDDQGRYVIDGLTTASDSLTALTDNLYYYYLEGQCELLKATAGELAFNGLVFHYNKSIPGKLSYYVFYVYGDGYYGAKRVIGDTVDIIIPLTPTDLLDIYGVNVLGVDAQGTRFDLYLNGRYVDGFTDVLIDGGGFGFYISKLSRSSFDNFTVKIERRDGGREDTSLPSVSSNVADGGEGAAQASFGGYKFPVIPKDPNRPTYSWEVGVDKTGKGKQPVAKATPMPPAEVPAEAPAIELTPAQEHRPPVEPVQVQPEPEPEPAPVYVEPEPEPQAVNEIEAVPAPAVEPEPAETLKPLAPDELNLPPGEELVASPETASEPAPDDQVQVSTEAIADAAPPVTQPLHVETYVDPADVQQAAAAAASESQEVTPVSTPQEEEEPELEPEPRVLSAPVIPTIELPFRPAPKEVSEPSAPDDGAAAALIETTPASEAIVEETAAEELPPTPLPVVAEPESTPLALQPPEPDDEPLPLLPREPVPEPSSGVPGATEPAASEHVEELMLSLKPADPPPAPEQDVAVHEVEEAPSEPVAGVDPWQTSDTRDELQDQDDFDVYGTLDDFDDYSGGIDLRPAGEPQREPSAEHKDADSSTASTEDLLLETSDAEPTLSLLPDDDGSPMPEEQGDRVVFSAPEPKYEGLDDLAGKRGADDKPAPEGDTGAPEPTPPVAGEEQATPAPVADDYFAREGVIVIEDDFTEDSWPVSESEAGCYRYFGAAYEIDNTGSETMAISYQNAALADCEASVSIEFLDGDSLIGFGLAGRFIVVDGQVSYYGLFISQSGEFLLLKALNGVEHVLVGWTAAAGFKPGTPNRITLEMRGNEITALINGEVVAQVMDLSIAAGGYALLAGPGIAARFDDLLVRGYQH